MSDNRIFPYVQTTSGKSSSLNLLLKNYDYGLTFLLLAVSFYGIIVIYGATYSIPGLSQYAGKQLVWMGVGFGAFLLVSLIDFRQMRQMVWPLYILVILSLAGLLFLGHKIKGARSWYSIGSFRIQPAEFAKIVVVVCLAHYLALKERPLVKIRDILLPILVAGLPAALILLQPDFGTAALFFPILLIMLYIGGASKKLIILLLLLAIWIGVSAYPFLKPYQKGRIKVFFQPELDKNRQGYNIRQAEISLGSGGLLGKGWKQGTQTRLRFLPERHTDFIFSSLGEQFGFLGCALLLFLYGLLIQRSLKSAYNAWNRFGRLTVAGFVACFLLHILFNVGMSLRLLPVTGLPLPLFSYGGSFLLTNYLIFGMLQSVNMRKFYY